MRSEVIETKDKVVTGNIFQMIFGKNMDNTFIRSAQLSLNASGENYYYDYLAVIPGAAFRLHFHPDWCPGSTNAIAGVYVSRVLFKYLGYGCDLNSIDTDNLSQIKELYQKIATQINPGIPIVAINLKVSPDWCII